MIGSVGSVALGSCLNHAGPVSPPALLSMVAGGVGCSEVVAPTKFSAGGVVGTAVSGAATGSIVAVVVGITGSGFGGVGTVSIAGLTTGSEGKLVGVEDNPLSVGLLLGISLATGTGSLKGADSKIGALGGGGGGAASITFGFVLVTPTCVSGLTTGLDWDIGVSVTLLKVGAAGVVDSTGLVGAEVKFGSLGGAIGLVFCSSGI